jgi:hypothetical protein
VASRCAIGRTKQFTRQQFRLQQLIGGEQLVGQSQARLGGERVEAIQVHEQPQVGGAIGEQHLVQSQFDLLVHFLPRRVVGSAPHGRQLPLQPTIGADAELPLRRFQSHVAAGGGHLLGIEGVGQRQQSLERFPGLAGFGQALGSPTKDLAALGRIGHQAVQFFGQLEVRGKIFSQEREHHLHQQRLGPQILRILGDRPPEQIERLGSLSFLQEHLPLQRQGLGIVGVGLQRLVDPGQQRLGEEERGDVCGRLRNELVLVADDVAQIDFGLGPRDDLALVQIDFGELLVGERQVIELVSIEAAAGGRARFQVQRRGPSRLAVGQVDRLDVVFADQDDFALMYAGDVEQLLARLGGPLGLAREHVQTVQLLRFDRRQDRRAAGDRGGRVDPIGLAGRGHRERLADAERAAGAPNQVGTRILIAPAERAGGQIDRHGGASRRGANQHAIGKRRRGASQAADPVQQNLLVVLDNG